MAMQLAAGAAGGWCLADRGVFFLAGTAAAFLGGVVAGIFLFSSSSLLLEWMGAILGGMVEHIDDGEFKFVRKKEEKVSSPSNHQSCLSPTNRLPQPN
jgi:hypothetical protein